METNAFWQVFFLLVVLAAPVLLVCIIIDRRKGLRGFGLTWTVGTVYIGSFIVMNSCKRDLVVWNAIIIFALSGIAIWFCLLVAIIRLPKHNGKGKISIGKLKEVLASKNYDYSNTPLMTIYHELNKAITALGYEPLGVEPYEVESVDDLFRMLAGDVEKVVTTKEMGTISLTSKVAHRLRVSAANPNNPAPKRWGSLRSPPTYFPLRCNLRRDYKLKI